MDTPAVRQLATATERATTTVAKRCLTYNFTPPLPLPELRRTLSRGQRSQNGHASPSYMAASLFVHQDLHAGCSILHVHTEHAEHFSREHGDNGCHAGHRDDIEGEEITGRGLGLLRGTVLPSRLNPTSRLLGFLPVHLLRKVRNRRVSASCAPSRTASASGNRTRPRAAGIWCSCAVGTSERRRGPGLRETSCLGSG